MPLASATPSPTSTPLSYRRTVLPGSALPVTVSVLSLVTLSPCTPVSVPTEITVGAAGGVVSMVHEAGAVCGLVLPAGSLAVAVKLWTPSGSTGVVKLNTPSGPATTVPIGLPLS